ncbi:nucleosidase, partial [Campylobacter lari]|nr:nucleosidase [Campylobacter lari]
MNRKIVILALFFGVVFAEDCQQYFESRKGELEIQTREFDEARQALEAFKASFESLQKEKMNA